MTLPDGSAPAPRDVHLVVFIGHYCPTLENPSWRVATMCTPWPEPGDTVTTAHVDVTCPDCILALTNGRTSQLYDVGHPSLGPAVGRR